MHNYFPYYQPIIDLSDGNIGGYESLARTYKGGRVISAWPLFLHRTFDQSYIKEIDRSVRFQALDNHKKYPDAGFLTINISPGWIDQLPEHSIAPTLSMIDQTGIDPSRVVIEITEIEGDIRNLKKTVKQYQDYGIKVAIDDFGAGASQLDRIAELETDFIKLDMGLLKAASLGGLKADIALSITSLVKRAGTRIICEGVETEQEFHFALECCADYVQGWVFLPALEKPVEKDSVKTLAKDLKASYLMRKSISVYDTVVHNQEVTNRVHLLSSELKSKGHDFSAMLDIEWQQFFDIGILRYYICDFSGDQVSPNYEIFPEGVCVNPGILGKNWSHRPYFSELLGMKSFSDTHMIVSELYKDRSSNKLCKTFSTFLEDKTILLIDVSVDDNVLFVESLS